LDVLREVIQVTKGKGKASQQAIMAPSDQVAQVEWKQENGEESMLSISRYLKPRHLWERKDLGSSLSSITGEYGGVGTISRLG
jgi:hypothetical protein